jgi:tetratricopeptide (TPR) repeat protein
MEDQGDDTRGVTPTERRSIEDEAPRTIVDRDIEGFDTPILPMKLGEAATIEMPFGVLALAADDLDTDRTSIPAPAVRHEPPRRGKHEEEQDTHEIRLPSRGSPEPLDAEGLDQETQQIQLPPELRGDEVDTDEVSLPQHRTNGTRTPVPGPVEPPPLDRGTDPTSRLDLADIELISGARQKADTLRDVLDTAKELRASSGDLTNKLQLSEVEVVGFFEAGRKKLPIQRGTSSQHERHGDETEFSQVPDSDDLREQEALETPPRGSDSVSRPRLPAIEVTERVRLPEELPRPVPARSAVRTGRTLIVRRIVVATIVVSGIAAIAAARYFSKRGQDESRELDRVRAVLADDTFESHRHALSVLSILSGRNGDGQPCAELASEAALMWGHFGLGEEHADTARRTLRSCGGATSTEAGVLAATLLAYYGGDLDEAATVGDDGVHWFPRSARLRVARAWILESRGEIEAARGELDIARRLDPVYIPASVTLARIDRRAGRFEDAHTLLDSVLRTSPRHIEARAEDLMLALDELEGSGPSQSGLEELQTLAASLESSAQEQPPALASLVALALGRFELVQGNVERAGLLLERAWLHGTKSQEATLHVARGLRLAGEIADALEVTKRGLHDAPEIRIERMNALLAAGRPGNVLADLREIGEAGSEQDTGDSPFDRAARVRLEAQALEQQGDLAAACTLLERHVHDAPGDETLLLLAEMSRARGDWNEAGRLFQSVRSEPWATCAEASRLELVGRYRDALGVLDTRGERRAPCTLRIRSLLSRRVGDPISEISALRAVMRLESRFDDRFALARSVWRERGASAALAEIRMVLESPPTGQEPLFAVVDLLATLGAEHELETVLARAREAGANRELLATASARAQRLLGRPAAALDLLDSGAGTRLPAAVLERAVVLLELRDFARTLQAAELVRTEAGSRDWMVLVETQAAAIRRRSGPQEADQVLERAIRQAEELGNRAAVLSLMIRRAEARVISGGRGPEILALLRAIPESPPDPGPSYLQGLVAETEGHPERAQEAYREALRIHPGHIESLRRLLALTGDPEYERRLSVLLLTHEPRTRPPASDTTDRE